LKKYKYTAVNLQKKRVSGFYIAEDENDLAKKLAEQNLYLLKAKRFEKTTANRFFTVSGKVSITELSAFCRQFSVLLSSGVTLIVALESLKNQSFSRLLKSTLSFVCQDVKGGSLLSEALGKHEKIFPHFFCSMISVGEASGALDKVLITLADYFQSDASISKKIKSAMVYPIILIILAIAIIVLMLTFVIPTFMDALSTMNIDMPAFTVALYNAGNFIRQNIAYILLVVILIALLIFVILKTEKGKYFFHFLKVKLPIFKKINTDIYTARFARAFAFLIDSGMDAVLALQTSKIVIGNKFIEKKLDLAIEDIKKGMSIADALDCYGIFPSLIIQMISVGEETDTLSSVLINACSFFDSRAEASLTNLATVIQPLILIIIGACVGALFYAVYSPLLQIMQNFGA